ncbi:TetR/AcrR family transcriptional regulator [Bacteroides sp. f07]|uniref:TetR/AcrR family transcriptional regulator n=1 Tax=Bacteroides sp. f07 TaxID=3132704 RepID=UPI0034BDC364
MEKEIIKNRQTTELTLIKAVDDIIEESGFEGLGINAIAAKAKVSKMLIYRYFNSLDGLIAAYIQQNDYWINFNEELPDKEHLSEFIKQIFKRQIVRLRESYTLKRLYRWELSTDNKFVKELRDKREEKGLWLIEAVSRLSKHPQKETAAVASIITAAISYLALLEENCQAYNGLKIQQETGWEQLEEGINLLVDLWLQKTTLTK